MSSRDSSSRSSDRVDYQDFRSAKSSDYKGQAVHRSGHKNISVYNHRSASYDTTAPTPSYGKSPGSKNQGPRTSSRS
ncbi:hypothetical protein F5B19DRAFT_498614 [Rostrohypoxylon terebratum]|nr:hypothetical protein F5B19DRAFT_498614 [Rostrohypoxylon terebratum]